MMALRTASLCALTVIIGALLLVIAISGSLRPCPVRVHTTVLPAGILLTGVGVLVRSLRKRHDASRNDTLKAAFVFLAVVLAVLTATGVWFRGPGMALGRGGAQQTAERR